MRLILSMLKLASNRIVSDVDVCKSQTNFLSRQVVQIKYMTQCVSLYFIYNSNHKSLLLHDSHIFCARHSC